MPEDWWNWTIDCRIIDSQSVLSITNELIEINCNSFSILFKHRLLFLVISILFNLFICCVIILWLRLTLFNFDWQADYYKTLDDYRSSPAYQEYIAASNQGKGEAEAEGEVGVNITCVP